MSGKRLDLSGLQFGRLTAIKPIGKEKRGVLWLCKCSCGGSKVVITNRLRSGNTQSCGCIHREMVQALGKSKAGLPNSRREDLTGMKFGMLEVIEFVEVKGRGRVMWKTRCDCGNEKVVTSSSLKRGLTTSCGCYMRKMLIETHRKNLTGKRFGRLTVTGFCGIVGSYSTWYTKCDCGNESVLSSHCLLSGHTQSCGCYQKDRLRESVTTHGKSKTKEYQRAMSERYRERSKIFDTKWTHEMASALEKMFPQCVYCGDTDNLQIDHVIPLSKGRGLEPGNATILCQRHNGGIKKAKSLDELPEDMRRAIVESAAKFKEYWESLQACSVE